MTDEFEGIYQMLQMDDPARNTIRMQVLTNPTAAQLRAVPLGSDTAILQPGGVFQYGVLDDDTRQSMIDYAEATQCGHFHGFLIYTPPVLAPDSTLSAEVIAENTVQMFDLSLRQARSDNPDPDYPEERVLRRMVEAAVHTAREGMVYPPF